MGTFIAKQETVRNIRCPLPPEPTIADAHRKDKNTDATLVLVDDGVDDMYKEGHDAWLLLVREREAVTSSKTPRQIVVGSPTLVERSTVIYDVRAGRPIDRYFSSERMFVTYDVDLTGVPEALLLVPCLSTLAPIAWALGAEIRVPTVDAVFLESLGHVQRALAHLHPTIDWRGDVRAQAVVDHAGTYPHHRDGLLFSGGVDSLTSFVTHRRGTPWLVSVWGADLGLDQRPQWEAVEAANRAFARSRSLDISFVKTNFRTFFKNYKLLGRFFRSFSNWYSAVQQGPGLTGLCAPLSYARGLGRILIPSTHTADFDPRWGTHPTIDNSVRWASTQVIHDGFDLSRQMKLALLAEYIREEDPRLQLRVCWGKGSNCSRCAKCTLTMLGLVLEGLDPNDHGFRFDAATLSHIRAQLAQGRMLLKDSYAWRLVEIQRKIPTRVPLPLAGLDEFLLWFQNVSIPHCQARYERHPRTIVRRHLDTRPEPVGRWIRRALGHPFP